MAPNPTSGMAVRDLGHSWKDAAEGSPAGPHRASLNLRTHPEEKLFGEKQQDQDITGQLLPIDNH